MQAWQATVQDEQGNVVFNPSVTVYLEDGVTLAPIFNEDGSPKGNPFTGSLEGFVQFWANPGVYKIVGANGSDSTEVWEVSLADYDRSGSYAEFINSYIPGRVNTASALVGDVLVSWRRDPAGPIGPTADGGMWSPVGEITVNHFGDVGGGVDDSAAFQAAADYSAATRAGRVVVHEGSYLVSGVNYGPFTVFTANGNVKYTLPDESNTYMFRALGFDTWADSVPARPVDVPVSIKRDYIYNSSPSARNSVAVAREYGVGQIVVTHPTLPRDSGWFVGEVWWLATSVDGTGFAASDANWIEVPSLLGALSSGFDGGDFDGNRANQTTPSNLIEHYGTAPYFRNCRIQNAGLWGLWVEVAGGLFSPQVGLSQQGTWQDIRVSGCGDSTSGNFYYNGQSDTDFVNLHCYATPEGGTELYIGGKAGGCRFHGGHVYKQTGLDAPNQFNWSWGIKCDAEACDWDMHLENAIWLNGRRHRGFFKIYSTHQALDTAAVWMNNPSMCEIHARTYRFLSVFRIYGADGGNNFLYGQLDHEPSKEGTAVLSGAGEPKADSTVVFARNDTNLSDNYVDLHTVRGNLGSGASFRHPDENTGLGFSGQGTRVVINSAESMLWTADRTVCRTPIRTASYTIATLPSGNTGDMAFATDGRKPSELAGSGTGIPVVFTNGQWRNLYDYSVASA